MKVELKQKIREQEVRQAEEYALTSSNILTGAKNHILWLCSLVREDKAENEALRAQVERLRQTGNRVINYGVNPREWAEAVEGKNTKQARHDAIDYSGEAGGCAKGTETETKTEGCQTMNQAIADHSRGVLKKRLADLEKKHHKAFRSKYSPDDPKKPIKEVVDEMPADKIESAIHQAQNAILKGTEPEF